MKENKYIVFLLQNSHDFLVYRMRLFIIVFTSFIAPIVMMWVLSSLPGKIINGANREQIITYYLTTSILYLFMNSKIDSFVKEAIQQGELATYLIKPVSFWLVAFVKDISGRIIRLVFGLPIFILLLLAYSQSFKLNLSDLGLTSIMIMLSFLIAFTFSFSLGLLTFWIEEVWGLQNVKEVSVVLLGGVALPYYFFPEALQRVLTYTPFPYLVNWPLRKGFSGNLALEFTMAVCWLIIFTAISMILWRKGLKKYSALGTY